MTGECYLHVFFPAHSKSLCTKRNLSKSYVIIAVAGLLLALNYPLNRSVSRRLDNCDRVVIEIIASDSVILSTFLDNHSVCGD
ncbi:hypothetical protein ANCCEY_08214 [Ancylostoma ceylanicum]|uniref:Uncharacterized protein n=1 Tax=Ancylostoma ceylanicum TaxID=53326 RepID=A0A0D6LYJ7_9BILA|nr:hypothetical protein ANCCEY_08214 [Ancylostoma ceylanicum]